MAENSKIEWTDATWNPVTGCTRASAGCDHCYAVTMTRRLEAMGQTKYAGLVNPGKGHFNGVVKCHPSVLAEPLKTKKPTTFFVCSMSDLFHKDVPFDFIDVVFAVMAMCPQHTFQLLTKRPERMAEYFTALRGNRISTEVRVMTELDILGESDQYFAAACRAAAAIGNGPGWPLPNVWLGTSVENQETADARIPHLLAAPAAVRFLSCEPLLGAVNVRRWLPMNACTCGEGPECPCNPRFSEDADASIDWVIVGGESGGGARPMEPAWARSLRDQCVTAGVAFHFKQWGTFAPRIVTPPTMQNGHLEFLPKEILTRLGKKEAGRVLDGRTWDELPAGKEVARG